VGEYQQPAEVLEGRITYTSGKYRLSGNIFDRKMLHSQLSYWNQFLIYEIVRMLLFDDFVALCHAVPLTKNIHFAYNFGE
jgi:hypothetical protein